MSSPTAFERRLLSLFLAGDHAVLELLRRQAASVSVASRDHTGVGVFVYFQVPDTVPTVQPREMVFGDVNVELANAQPGVAALLFIEAGRLRCLELVTASGPWPAEPIVAKLGYLREIPTDPDGYSLVPCSTRDAATLARALRGGSDTSAA
jgi:hypothetical protein